MPQRQLSRQGFLPGGLLGFETPPPAKGLLAGAHVMDQLALASSPIPGIGDAMGLAADARMFMQQPETRTPLNFGLSALGLLPFVPGLATIRSVKNADYMGHHRPAPREGANTLDNLSDVYPKDIYSDPAAWRYYGHGENPAMDKASVEIVKRFANNPNAKVRVYRAVPKGVDKINEGDWVTINKDYAKSHGSSWVDDGDYRIIEMEVPANSLTTSGDSIHEWGYYPLKK